MLVKKVIHAVRNLTVAAAQLLLPIIFTALALSVEKAIPAIDDAPALALNLNPFDPYTVTYSSGKMGNSTSLTYANTYKDQFTGVVESVDRTKYTEMDTYYVAMEDADGIATFNRCVGDWEIIIFKLLAD